MKKVKCPHAIGYMVVDAPASALNNIGKDFSSTNESLVLTKVLKRNDGPHAYMSARSYKYQWRKVLAEFYGLELSPVEREEKIAFTAAMPEKYDDDDIFGYMRAESKKKKKKSKGKKAEKSEESAEPDARAVTRVAPFQMGPLISIAPTRIMKDFSTMTRQDGNPVPFTQDAYAAEMESAFVLDLDSAGHFVSMNQAGLKNFLPEDPDRERLRAAGCIEHEDGSFSLPVEKRAARVETWMKALAHISGGAKNTIYSTDIVPRFVVLANLQGGNNIFQCLGQKAVSSRSAQGATVNMALLEEMLVDYKEELIGDVYIGCDSGFFADIDFKAFKARMGKEHEIGCVRVCSVKSAIDSFAKDLAAFIKERHAPETSPTEQG